MLRSFNRLRVFSLVTRWQSHQKWAFPNAITLLESIEWQFPIAVSIRENSMSSVWRERWQWKFDADSVEWSDAVLVFHIITGHMKLKIVYNGRRNAIPGTVMPNVNCQSDKCLQCLPIVHTVDACECGQIEMDTCTFHTFVNSHAMLQSNSRVAAAKYASSRVLVHSANGLNFTCTRRACHRFYVYSNALFSHIIPCCKLMRTQCNSIIVQLLYRRMEAEGGWGGG